MAFQEVPARAVQRAESYNLVLENVHLGSIFPLFKKLTRTHSSTFSQYTDPNIPLDGHLSLGHQHGVPK